MSQNELFTASELRELSTSELRELRAYELNQAQARSALAAQLSPECSYCELNNEWYCGVKLNGWEGSGFAPSQNEAMKKAIFSLIRPRVDKLRNETVSFADII